MSISYRFACRRRTAASWVTNNDVLLSGEVGYETDTDKFKIGDGVTAWNSISTYFTKAAGGTWGSITGTLSAQTDLNSALALKAPLASPTFTGTVSGITAAMVGAPSGSGTSTGSNTGDQTNITGNAATVTTNANLTGHVTSVGNAAVLGSFTVAQLNTAISDADVATGGGTATGTNTGDQDLSSYATTSAVAAAYQPLDADLTAIAALSPSNDDILQRKAGAWTNRTMAQLATDLGAPSLSSANTWTALQTFSLEDAGTTTVLYPAKFTRTSSGTPANGIGVGCQFEVETTAGNNEIGATLEAVTTDVTSTSEDFALIVKTMVAGSTSLVIGGRWVGAQYRAPDGSATVPSYSFSSSSSVGFYDGGGVPALATGTVLQLYWNNSETRYRQSHSLNFMASGGSVGGTVNASMCHAGDNAFIFADSASPAAGATKSRQEKNKQVTAIADATATTVFTVTVPNAAHSAMIKVTLAGSIGAGGAIGANEATGTVSYDIAIARTAGVNAVATISSAYGSVTSAVAGATTITVAGDLGAVSGAVGASNTFTIRVTITKGGGSSANHTCMAYARVLNANASGITIA